MDLGRRTRRSRRRERRGRGVMFWILLLVVILFLVGVAGFLLYLDQIKGLATTVAAPGPTEVVQEEEPTTAEETSSPPEEEPTIAEETTKSDEVADDEAANRDGLLGSVFSERGSLPEDFALSEDKSLSSENTTAYSDNPAQLSTDQYTKATPQSVPVLGPSLESPNVTEASPSPPADTSSPRRNYHKAGKARDKRKRS
jgi:cytoskeletal protein RodZ